MSDSFQRYFRNPNEVQPLQAPAVPHSLVSASIQWLQSINDVYGGDRGMEIWQKMAEEVSPDLQMAVFRAMLSGGEVGEFQVGLYGTHDIVASPPSSLGYRPSDKVERIKAVRLVSDLGLRQAKTIIEEVEAGHAIQFTARTLTRDGSEMNQTEVLAYLEDVGLVAEIR